MSGTGTRRLVPALAVTETVSWGILYYAFPVLLATMGSDLRWDRSVFVGAYTVAIVCSGLAAFPVGRYLDRRSGRWPMTAGSVLGVVSVLGWAAARSPVAFYAAWLGIGLAMALVLYEPAQIVLVKAFGAQSPRAITRLTLVAGFASTIFQPLTAALTDLVGWRRALLLLAALLTITVPVHARVLPRAAPAPVLPRRAGPTAVTTARPASARRSADSDRLLTVAFTLAATAMAATVVHLVPYLVDEGWGTTTAAAVAGTLGVAQVTARLAFGRVAQRTDDATLAATILALPAVGALLLATGPRPVMVWTAVALLGVAQGTTTLLRPMLLARRHGHEDYGRRAAGSAAAMTVARAVAPLLMALVAVRAGYGVGFVGAAALAAAAGITAHRATRVTERPPVGVLSERFTEGSPPPA